VGTSVYSVVHQHMIKTMTVGAEYTDVVYNDYGFIQVQESLITANKGGDVKIAVKDGERVPKNHEVFSVTTTNEETKKKSTKHYYANISGIVSYRIDGYEKMTKTNEIKALDFRKLYEENINENTNENADKEAVAGEVYAKVIDNLKGAYLYMSYDPAKNTIFSKEGDEIRIRFPELGESTTGTVQQITNNGENTKFCRIALGPVSENFLKNRVVQTEVYKVQTATLELPKSAIVKQDGKNGVYISVDGICQWKAVKVLEVKGDNVECETLDEGTVVILTPHLVAPGDSVKGK
ncbi:MAG: HlyD family efflux transporter periplasmic adaptor subunit, partial [Peptococcaceae bacterium]|nr:HlyD family efflux transporter periplasmic adaptor subunit [Peptococcaceae bacterium]